MATATKDELLNDEERLQPWKFAVDIAQLQLKGITEMQELLRREEKARDILEARFELFFTENNEWKNRQLMKEAELTERVATLEHRLSEEENARLQLKQDLENEKQARQALETQYREDNMILSAGLAQLKTDSSDNLNSKVGSAIEELGRRLQGLKVEQEHFTAQSCAEAVATAGHNCKNLLGQYTDSMNARLDTFDSSNRDTQGSLAARTQHLESVCGVLEPRMDRAENNLSSLTSQVQAEITTRETLSYTTSQFETKTNTRLDAMDTAWKNEQAHMQHLSDNDRKSRQKLEDDFNDRTQLTKELQIRVQSAEGMMQNMEARMDSEDAARKDLENLVRSAEVSNNEFVNLRARFEGVQKQSNRHDLTINSMESKMTVHEELLQQLGEAVRAR